MYTTVWKLFINPVTALVIFGSGVALADNDSDYSGKGGLTPASGEFKTTIFPDTLTLTPAGDKCLVEVKGLLEFTGTLVGVAPGKTRALVFADCDTVAGGLPQGIFFEDVFKSNSEFLGTVNGEPASADIIWKGFTETGGTIDKSVMILSNGAKGVLKVKASVGVGGSYTGVVKGE